MPSHSSLKNTFIDVCVCVSQLGALVTALRGLLLKDKAWVSAALDHLRRTFLESRSEGAAGAAAAADQRRHLFGFDLGNSVGLELAPSVQQLAELLLCSQGEEVRLKKRGGSRV